MCLESSPFRLQNIHLKTLIQNISWDGRYFCQFNTPPTIALMALRVSIAQYGRIINSISADEMLRKFTHALIKKYESNEKKNILDIFPTDFPFKKMEKWCAALSKTLSKLLLKNIIKTYEPIYSDDKSLWKKSNDKRFPKLPTISKLFNDPLDQNNNSPQPTEKCQIISFVVYLWSGEARKLLDS